MVDLVFGGTGALWCLVALVVDLVGSGERPSLAAAAALQLQPVQWTGEQRELQDKEELEKKQEEYEEQEKEQEEDKEEEEIW